MSGRLAESECVFRAICAALGGETRDGKPPRRRKLIGFIVDHFDANTDRFRDAGRANGSDQVSRTAHAEADNTISVAFASADLVADMQPEPCHVTRMTRLPYDPAEVGERVAALRKSLGLSQAQFARLIGAQSGEIGSWESGLRRPSIAKVKPLVDRYGVTLDWLFLGDASGLPYGLARKILAPNSEPAQPDQD